jgi:hypothetical protein
MRDLEQIEKLKQLCLDYPEAISWYEISSSREILSDLDFVKKVRKNLNWHYVSNNMKLEDLPEFARLIGWSKISDRRDITIDFIEKYKSKLDWYKLSYNYKVKFTEEFIDKYSKYLDWKGISTYRDISLKTIEKYGSKIDFKNICSTKKLSPEIIKKNLKKIDWYGLSSNHKIPVKTKLMFKKHILWEYALSTKINKKDHVALYKAGILAKQALRRFFCYNILDDKILQDLSKDFDEGDWDYAIRTQKLTPDLIKKNLNKIDVKQISYNSTISSYMKRKLKKIHSLYSELV